MLSLIGICCLSFCHLIAFADQSVSVQDGDSVTLNSETELRSNEVLKWRFGLLLIAEINKGFFNVSTHDGSDRFKDRLKLDKKTGSLTINNIRSTDAGVYELRRKTVDKFNVTVYARLPVPVISRDSLRNRSSSLVSSVPKCVLLCSVVNVSHVTLSWLRGNSLLSRISVSGLSISLSLSLECLNDSYSCVEAYSFTNQTTHLTNPDLCQKCPAAPYSLKVSISAVAAGSLVIAAAVVIFCIHRKYGKTDQVETQEEIIYSDPVFYKREAEK